MPSQVRLARRVGGSDGLHAVHLGAGSWGLFARPIFDPDFGILYHMVSGHAE